MTFAKVTWKETEMIGRVEITKSNDPRKRTTRLMNLKKKGLFLSFGDDVQTLEEIRLDHCKGSKATKTQMGAPSGFYVVYINNTSGVRINMELENTKEEALAAFFSRVNAEKISSDLFHLIDPAQGAK